METMADVVQQVDTLLRAHNTDDAVQLITNPDHKESVSAAAWDLVPALCRRLETGKNLTVVENLLEYLVGICNAKEMLLVLLEQADRFIDGVLYKVLLRMVTLCLSRFPAKKGHSMGVALETLYGHIAALPLPPEHQLEGKEKLLLEVDDNVLKILDVLPAFVRFLEPQVLELSWRSARESHDSQLKTVEVLASYLLKVLDHPMAYLDLATHPSQSDPDQLAPKSTNRVCAEKVIQMLGELHPNFHRCVVDISLSNGAIRRRRALVQKEKAKRLDRGEDFDEMDNYDLEEEVTLRGLSVFLSLTLGEGLGHDGWPQVFTGLYQLQFLLPYINCLLGGPELMVVDKGLKLLAYASASIGDMTFEPTLLESTEIKLLIEHLLQVMTSSKVKELAQTAVKLLKCFLLKFTLPARGKLIMYLMKTCRHVGVGGYVIGLLKDEIDKNLKLPFPDACFTGPALEKLLQVVFSLPNAEKSDLLEQSERIIAALNLLRYILIRDKAAENVTGVWNLVPMIEASYCEILRKAINMSRAHYELDLDRALQGQSRGLRKPGQPDLELAVGDQPMGPMGVEQEVHFYQLAIHTFDMMESLVGRATEIISQRGCSR